MAYEVEERPLFGISSYITVMSVMDVILEIKSLT
jgi:hypothetical protein